MLTPQQTRAIESECDLTVVQAGPGSGKTMIVEYRAIYCSDELRAKDMLVLTFSRAAANEIYERLGGWGKWDEPGRMRFIGTVHGFALSLINSHSKMIGFPGQTIAIASDELYRNVIKDGIRHFKYRITMTEALKGEGEIGERLKTHADRWLLESGMVTYSQLLRSATTVALSIDGGVDDLIVDEAQDLSPEEWAFVKVLRAKRKTFVGDMDQSIYGWRGATPKLFTELAERAKEDGLFVHTEDNFRCSVQICAAASRVLRTTTLPMTQKEGLVKITESDTAVEEIEDLTSRIAESLKRNCVAEDIAVLCRTRVVARDVVAALTEATVPVRSINYDPPAPDWEETIEAVSLLTAQNNKILGVGVMQRELAKLDVSEEMLENPRPWMQTKLMQTFVQTGCLTAALAASGISKEAVNAVIERMETRRATLAGELIEDLVSWKEWSRWSGEGVTVSTIHAAKGLQWRAVYLPRWVDGEIPSRSKRADIQEELRLAYVAITRAKREVIISYCRSQKNRFTGKTDECLISPFLRALMRNETGSSRARAT